MQRKMIQDLDVFRTNLMLRSTDVIQLSLDDEKVALKCLRRLVDEHGSTLFLEGKNLA